MTKYKLSSMRDKGKLKLSDSIIIIENEEQHNAVCETFNVHKIRFSQNEYKTGFGINVLNGYWMFKDWYFEENNGVYNGEKYKIYNFLQLFEEIKECDDCLVQEDQKYMIYVENGRTPKMIHETLESAEKEAKRLAQKEIGKNVMIVQVVKSFKSKVIVEEVK